MTKEDKKTQRKRILDEAFNITNGNASKAIGNWLQLLAWPVRLAIVVIGIIIALTLGNIKQCWYAIMHLPETTEQVDDNTEDIGVLFVYHEKQEERLDEIDDQLLVQETREHYRRRVD